MVARTCTPREVACALVLAEDAYPAAAHHPDGDDHSDRTSDVGAERHPTDPGDHLQYAHHVIRRRAVGILEADGGRAEDVLRGGAARSRPD